MKTLGITLIAIGLAAFAYQGYIGHSGINYSDLGPAEAWVQDSPSLSIPLIIGLASLIDGTALLLFFKNVRGA